MPSKIAQKLLLYFEQDVSQFKSLQPALTCSNLTMETLSLFKVNNKGTKTTSWCGFGVFIVYLEQISYIVLVSPWLTLRKKIVCVVFFYEELNMDVVNYLLSHTDHQMFFHFFTSQTEPAGARQGG